ncbi:hypothetical protein G6F46_014023 [Rhizopus delemar]|nr:hypothetical protein G6F46_014023 [Rhizopus delemar]
MQLAQLFAVHAAGPLRHPVVGAGKQREQGTRHQHVVEVRHHEVGVVVLEVGRHDGQHQAGETTDGEQDDEGHRPQHRRLERQRATPHGADPVEHLHAGRDRDDHRRDAEEGIDAGTGAHGEEVVQPDQERQHADGGRGVDHGLVAEQRLAGEGGTHFRIHAKRRQHQDVHLRMAPGPHQKLKSR